MAFVASLLVAYWHTLLAGYCTTVALILIGSGWGGLPWAYLKVVNWFQRLFPDSYPRAGNVKSTQWPQLIEKPSWSRLVRPHPEGAAYFDFIREKGAIEGKPVGDSSSPDLQQLQPLQPTDLCDIWDATTLLTGAGLNAIAQDEFSAAFSPAPSFCFSMNGFTFHPDWTPLQKLIFGTGIVIRLLFLLPIRIALVASSFIWTFIWAPYAYLTPLPIKLQTYIAITYSRLYCAGTGVVAEYTQGHNRPTQCGLVASSHLTPNDVHILTADIPIDTGNSYLVTGQRHKGIIGLIENMAARIIPTLWLDRACTDSRKNFAEKVLTASKERFPVLFFPEGYCSNNTQVLQFRRAIFVRDVDVHPIAIRQDSRFGDGFWSEDVFKDYMIRILTSWAVVYKVIYLPAMRRGADESASEFAARVHDAIADAAEVRPAVFDGSFWYKKTEQAKVLATQREALAQLLCAAYEEEKTELNASLLAAPIVDRTLSEECASDAEAAPAERENDARMAPAGAKSRRLSLGANSGGILGANNNTINIPEIVVADN